MSDIKDFEIDDTLNDIDVETLLDDIEKVEVEEEDKIEYKELEHKVGGHTISEKIDQSIDRSLYKKNQNGLSKAQLIAIEMTCKGFSINKISKEIHVSRQTIYNWQNTQEYQRMLEKVQKEYLSAYKQALMSEIPKAVKTLANIMNDDLASYKDKINASRSILEFSNIKQGGIRESKDDKENFDTVTMIQVNMIQQQSNDNQLKKSNDILENVDYDDIIDN
jgi:hypothetical protein